MMNAATEESLLQSMLQHVDIPPCPAVLVAVDAELKKEAPDQREIARLISRDVALSGHVMQIVNSPAFSTGNSLTSLIQALSVLGTRQIFNMVIVQLLKNAMAGAPEIPLDRFWETSALAARVSAELAKRLRCGRPDMAYTFGLFRDCGIPLLMKRFPRTREVLSEANCAENASFTEVEEKHLGTNHAVVGYFLARRWHLPPDVAEGILRHHDYQSLVPENPLSGSVKSLIAVAVLAEHIVRLHTQGTGEYEWIKAAPAACGVFDLSLGAVDDLIEDVCDWLG